jgi:hypothetical protein
LLASQTDDVTRYYACLAICVLGSSKEMEAAVIKSGTLALVEPFLAVHEPTSFARNDYNYKHSQGRHKEWLQRYVFHHNSNSKLHNSYKKLRFFIA